MHDSPVGMFDSEQANFEVVMNALGVSRWLQAYDEVSENGYFNFDYQEAMKAFPVDLMRLGRKAFQDNAEATAEAFDDEEATQDQLAAACLSVCLANRSSTLAHSLRKSFGSPTGLLWALYTSIWPALTKPMDEACGHTVALGELMPQWQFVEEGWEILPRTEHGRKNRLRMHDPGLKLTQQHLNGVNVELTRRPIAHLPVRSATPAAHFSRSQYGTTVVSTPGGRHSCHGGAQPEDFSVLVGVVPFEVPRLTKVTVAEAEGTASRRERAEMGGEPFNHCLLKIPHHLNPKIGGVNAVRRSVQIE